MQLITVAAKVANEIRWQSTSHALIVVLPPLCIFTNRHFTEIRGPLRDLVFEGGVGVRQRERNCFLAN